MCVIAIAPCNFIFCHANFGTSANITYALWLTWQEWRTRHISDLIYYVKFIILSIKTTYIRINASPPPPPPPDYTNSNDRTNRWYACVFLPPINWQARSDERMERWGSLNCTYWWFVQTNKFNVASIGKKGGTDWWFVGRELGTNWLPDVRWCSKQRKQIHNNQTYTTVENVKEMDYKVQKQTQ